MEEEFLTNSFGELIKKEIQVNEIRREKNNFDLVIECENNNLKISAVFQIQ